MADASYLQANFLGGEVSAYYQGRMDDPQYRTMMNLCRNAMPVEEGSWTRRGGTQWLGNTYMGQPAFLKAFYFNTANPYIAELTPGTLRFWSNNALVLQQPETILSGIDTGTPATLTTTTKHGFTNGEEVEFYLLEADPTNFSVGYLLNRQFLASGVTDYTFEISDTVTDAGFDGALVTLGSAKLAVSNTLAFTTPYGEPGTTNGIDTVRLIQGTNFALLTQAGTAPHVIANATTPTADAVAQLSFQPATFTDGPYLDAPGDGSTMTPGGTSGTITLSVSWNVWASGSTYATGDVVGYNGVGYTSLQDSNTGNEPDVSSEWWQVNVSNTGVPQFGFLPTDVGRMVRLIQTPDAWAIGTTYAAGDTVTYDGTYWTSLTSGNVGNEPDISLSDWQIAPSAAVYTWGIITAYTSATEVDFTLLGGPLLSTAPCTYQFGLYSDTTGWPVGGVYHMGRLWLFGKTPNRIDGSYANQPFNFAPTAADGTVSDANAIAAEFNSPQDNEIFWMISQNAGIVIGTKSYEFLASATNVGDGLTPSSIQVKPVTKFGCENVEPRLTPLATVHVQRYGRKLIEYIADVYSGKFSGTDIALKGKHLTASGIAEIAYQQETTPIVWCRMNDGSLAGVTYKRDSPFGTQPASFIGWHSHTLGSGNIVTSIQETPSQNGDLDTIMLVTKNPSSGVCWVEKLTDIFGEDDDITNAWELDAASGATGVEISGGNMIVTGYAYLAGKTVSAWVAGLDLGDFTVDANGAVTIPFSTTNPLFTPSYLATVAASGIDFSASQILIVPVVAPSASLPDITGITELQPGSDGIGKPNPALIAVEWDGPQSLNFGYSGGTGYGVQTYYLVNGAEANHVSASTFYTGLSTGDSGPPGTGYNDCVALSKYGYFYFYASGSNLGIARNASLGDLALTGNYFGAEGALPPASPPYAWGVPNSMAMIYAEQPYVVMSEQASNTTTQGLASASGATFNLLSTFNDNEINWGTNGQTLAQWVTGRGPIGNYGEGLGIASSLPNTFQDYILVSRMAINNGAYELHQFGTVTMAQVTGYAAWGTFQPPSTPIFDGTDNSIIVTAQINLPANYVAMTTYAIGDYVVSASAIYVSLVNSNTGNTPASSPTDWSLVGTVASFNLNWMFKISPVDASLKWSVPIPSFPGFAGHSYTRISNGVLAYAFGDGYLSLVNTATGAITHHGSLAGVTNIAGQSYDDVTGRMVVSCDYSQTTGGPAPINGTPTSFTARWAVFQGIAAPIVQNESIPFTIGYNFVSQGQVLRPIIPPETGAQNGPALGKTRRTHMYSMLLTNVQNLQVGTDFSDMYPVQLQTASGVALPANQLYSGVLWDTLQDDYTFDSLLAWQATRPFPATVNSVEGFIQTQDR